MMEQEVKNFIVEFIKPLEDRIIELEKEVKYLKKINEEIKQGYKIHSPW